MCPHPPQRTGVAIAEGKIRPQTHGVDSVYLRRHFSSKSLPSTIQRPKARVNYQKMIIDPRYEPYTSGTGPEPNPRLGYQARPGRSRSRTWRVRVGQSGSLPGPCSTNLDRSWSLDGEDRSRTGRLRVGQSGSPTHCRPGPEPDLRPSYRTGLGLGRSRTCGHTSVAQTCWDCRQAGGNQQGRGTQSRRSCPMGPDSDGFIMNRLEEGALGDPVLAGNLVSDLDGRLRHS